MHGCWSKSFALAGWVAVVGLSAEGSAAAQSLEQALTDAYNDNPQIQAERALLRATDETVPQALSGWRPTVELNGAAGPQWQNNAPIVTTIPKTFNATLKTADLSVTQPVYQWRTTPLTAQAEKTVQAERAHNTAVEETVFFSVIQAYLDVLRDQDVLELNVSNEHLLHTQFDETTDQYRVGTVTRTDLAQAEARYNSASADRVQAEGNLQVSRANYERFVGHPPGKLIFPELHPSLPATRAEALASAEAKNPAVIAASFNEDAARDAIEATRAQLLPDLALVADVNQLYDTNVIVPRSFTGSLVARLKIPLYEGGQIYSQTRQAIETMDQRRSQTDDARQQAVQGTAQAWETIQTTRARIVSLESTVRAAATALEGIRREQAIGVRTVIDTLNAAQEFFTDKVNLVTSHHDEALAEFSLAQQIGKLTAANLGLPVTLYDEDDHYQSVRDKWIGFGSSKETKSNLVVR
jgi:outer membrane protein